MRLIFVSLFERLFVLLEWQGVWGNFSRFVLFGSVSLCLSLMEDEEELVLENVDSDKKVVCLA